MSNLKELLVVSDQDIANARSYFQKSQSDIQQDVAILKEWLRQQPHLPHDEDEERLERMFLRNKCRLEQTKKKLDKCYSFKVFYPEMLDMYDIKSARMQNARKSLIYVPLPKLTEKQERIFCFKMLNAEAFHGLDFYMYILMMIEICNTYDYSLGNIQIMDWADFSFNAMKSIEPSLINKYATISMEALSGRFVHMYCINSPNFIDMFLQIVKAVMKPKLFSKIECCSSLENLHKVISKKILPIEFGGEEKSMYKLHEEWDKELEHHRDLLLKISKRISDEKLRIEKMDESDSFGTEGSFRKINLD